MPQEPDFDTPVVSMVGQGLYAGKGLYGSGVSYGGSKGLISGKLSRQNVALQSQPQFTNEIMRRQMGKSSIVY
jgi:hypothetical protein